jgi:hypothetical protein
MVFTARAKRSDAKVWRRSWEESVKSTSSTIRWKDRGSPRLGQMAKQIQFPQWGGSALGRPLVRRKVARHRRGRMTKGGESAKSKGFVPAHLAPAFPIPLTCALIESAPPLGPPRPTFTGYPTCSTSRLL